jgi:hypothetical protein
MSDIAAADTKHYKGKCHCGKVAFGFDHVSLESSKPIECNCTICKDRGYLLVYASVLTQLTPGALGC